MFKRGNRLVLVLLIALAVVGVGIISIISYSFIAFQSDFSEDILPGESSEACVALSGKVGIVESQYLCSTEGVTGFSVSLGEGIDSFRAVFSGDSGSEEVVIRDGESSSNLRMLTKGFNEPLEVGLGSLVYVYSGGFDSVEVYPVSNEDVCGLADSKIINPCSAVIGTLISIDNTDDEQLQESNESVEEETNQGGGGGGSSGGSGGSSTGNDPPADPVLSVTIIEPSGNYGFNESIPIDYTLENPQLADSCWYSLDGNDNVSLPGCSNSTFDVSDGTHIIIVYANDTDGNVVSDGNSFAYDISFPPVVSFSASVTSGFEPLSVDFDASDSSDPDGEIVSYSWDFDNDGTEDATGVTTSNVFSAGSYVVNLTVTDDDGLSGSFTRGIEVSVSDDDGGEVSGHQAIARWDVVPYQTFDGDFEIGVVAFHKDGIDNVTFEYVDKNGIVQSESVSEMSLNPRTDVWEYWITLSASDFNDGPIMINATAYPNNGEPRVLAGNINENTGRIDFSNSDDARIRGEYSLVLNANFGGTLQSPERWVDAVNGNDETGDGSEGNPFKTLVAAVVSINDVEGSADGATIWMREGNYHWGEISSSANVPSMSNRWMTFRSAPGADRDNVRIVSSETGTAMRTKLNRFYNITANSSIAYSGAGSFNSIWMDDSVMEGSDPLSGGSSQINTQWTGGVWYTDNKIHDQVRGLHYVTLARNTELWNIGIDAVRDPTGIVVNTKVRDLIDNSSAHNDVVQFFSTGDSETAFENIIIYNLEAVDNIQGQSLFWNAAHEPLQRDIAIVNFIVNSVDSITGVAFNNPMDNVLIDHMTLLNTRFELRNSAAITNFSLRNSVIEVLRLVQDEGYNIPNMDDQSWADNNHFIDTDLFQAVAPGINATTGGSLEELFADPDNGDYSPKEGSILIGSNRPVSTDLVVPVDVNNNVRPSDGSASIGALEFGSSVQEVQFSDEITQYNITWTFDDEYPVGQFINGDWWVAPNEQGGNVIIVAMDPPYEDGKNGWEVNKMESFPQGFDDRVVGGFNESLIHNLPYAAQPNSSIIKSISLDIGNSSCRPCLKTVAVLTVLDEVPENNGMDYFRPPMLGTKKPLVSFNDINTSRLPRVDVPQTTSMYSFADLTNRFRMPQLDVSSYPGEGIRAWDNFLGPLGTYRGYGGRVAVDTGDAALSLMLDYPFEEKKDAFIAFTQYGLDLYYGMDAGFQWTPNGGHGSGRKLPVLFVAYMFNDSDMRQRIIEASDNDIDTFQEDGFLYEGTAVGLSSPPILFGKGTSTYWLNIVTDYGSRTSRDPYGYIDSRIPGTSYQEGINSHIWKGPMIAMQIIPELQEMWGQERYGRFEEYVDRWVYVGAWAQPDPCASPRGVCIGGDNEGAECTYANPFVCDSNICGAGVCPSGPDTGNACGFFLDTGCADDESGNQVRCKFNEDYGVTYGPNSTNPDLCILDENIQYFNSPNDFACREGETCGRFPYRHGENADGSNGAYHSIFVDVMWDAYRGNFTIFEPPKMPEDFSAIALESTKLYLTWSDVETETEYILQRSIDNETFVTIAQLAQDSDKYTDESVDSSTLYYYRLYASNSLGNSSSAYTSQQTFSDDPIIIPEGLVGYWSFNEGDVTDILAYDKSGTASHGTRNGTQLVEGILGESLFFDAILEDYVYMDGASALDLREVVSLSVWAKNSESTPSSRQVIASKGGTQTGAQYEQYYIDVSGVNLRFRVSNGTQSNGLSHSYNQDDPLLNWSEWHHIVGVYDGTDYEDEGYIEMKLYVDGQQVLSDNVTGFGSLLNSEGHFRVGVEGRALRNYWNGSIDEVRVYDRALNDSEILNIYNSAFEPLSSPVEQNGMWENLVENIRQLFSISLSRTLYDSSGNYGSGITGRAVDSSGNGTSGGVVFVIIAMVVFLGIVFFVIHRNKIRKLRRRQYLKIKI